MYHSKNLPDPMRGKYVNLKNGQNEGIGSSGDEDYLHTEVR